MKQTLKQEIFGKRKALSRKDVKENSNKIKKSLYSLQEFKQSKNILFYVSFNSEVSTIGIIKELLIKKEKNIIVPYVLKNNPILQLSELRNINNLAAKTFGILEPKENYIREFSYKNIEMVILPGIAFDTKGHRIGYGYGYYDRFLKKLNKNVIKIGFAFDFQLVEKIPEERHDVAVDIIITEKRVLKVQ